MNALPLPMRLLHFLRGRDRPPIGCEAADMGTSFGLEMSLDQNSEPPPRARRGSTGLNEVHTGWLRRLAQRYRAAS